MQNVCFKWLRVRGEKSYLLKEQNSYAYVVTCEDIDAFLQLEISESSGSDNAICKIGPVRLDRSVRKSLEYILNKGTATFPLSCTGDLDYNNASDLILDITPDVLRLTTFSKDGAKDERNSFETPFSVTFPKITLHPFESSKICFEMNELKTDENDSAFSRKLLVSCLNQQTRDLILMSIRVFALKNSAKIDKALSFYLEDFANCKTDQLVDHSLTLQETNELFLENLSLKKQLSDISEVVKSQKNEIFQLRENFERLEMNQDDSRLKAKIEKLNEEKSILKQKVKNASKEINELKEKGKELNSSSSRSELAAEELEIAFAKNKTLTEKVRRQKEALEEAEVSKKENSEKITRLQEQVVNYALLVNENKEFIKRITKNAEILREKDLEIKLFQEKLDQITSRHEKSNSSLVQEINRLAEELENCKKCQKLQESLNKAKEEVLFYRNQCDTISANLSRAQAQIRRSSCSRRS